MIVHRLLDKQNFAVNPIIITIVIITFLTPGEENSVTSVYVF